LKTILLQTKNFIPTKPRPRPHQTPACVKAQISNTTSKIMSQQKRLFLLDAYALILEAMLL
jgi:hypothetical protein